MHAITLVIIYNYVLFGFRSNIIFIILYDLQYSNLCVYSIRNPTYFSNIYILVPEVSLVGFVSLGPL